jgi:CubicO group peptidase (beta-lactamase class C family)
VLDILNGTGSSKTNPIKINILPGISPNYSGGGYTVAQLALTEYLNKPFPQIMKELIIDPMNLNCTFEQPLPKKLTRIAASGHVSDNLVIPGGQHVYPEMAAAGLWTSATDLAKIMIEMQTALKSESKIFSKETIEEMLRPQKVDSHRGIGFVLDTKVGDIFMHGGVNEGFVSMFVAYKTLGKGAVIMTNSMGGGIINEILRSIATVYVWPNYIPTPKQIIPLDKKIMEKYVGSYKSNLDIDCEVEMKRDKLFIKINKNTFEIEPVSQNEFSISNLNTKLKFEENKMILSQNRMEYFFMKEFV